MPYVLGIHVGATATSAAIARRDGGRWGAATPLPLGAAGHTVPTVLCRVQDGSFVAGEQASKQELTHHEWVVRGFTRQVGDEAPLLVGSEFISAQALVAAVVEWVADTVAHQLGHPAEHITLAHSATWGPFRAHLVRQALAALGLRDVTLVPEPVAVAVDYASRQQVAEQDAVAVADIGGTGFDATVLRRRSPGFDVVGSTLDTGHPSGQDLDDEIFSHLLAEFGPQLDGLDASDPAHRAALVALRGDCARGKEALSYHPGTTVRIELPGLRTDFALSRPRYEQLVRSHLERVPELLLQAVQSAAVAPEDLAALVLAGGTARTPLVKQLVAERLERAPQVDAAPELVAARGAAASAVGVLSAVSDRGESAAETSVLVRVEGPGSGGLDVIDGEPEREEPPRPPVQVEPMYLEPPDEDRQRLLKILKLGAAALLIIGGLVLTIVQGFGGQTPTSPVQTQQR
ncbi:Hsp70 family protein [Saccharopolyspora gregorii]|uniref:Hsp70 family protein n=1 Tax=Saccharopolyspora gregorii TaxID=33914 RepID=A0ABP6RZ41_9PSEU|nr:Hsp70 family protein [Saccharopolyspora gregorii]